MSLEDLCDIAEIEEERGEAETEKPKKGIAWSETEHARFLDGLSVLGKGNWRGISRQFVTTRSPTQVASHAQKYFLRLLSTTRAGASKRRSRFTALESRPKPTLSLRGHSNDGSSSPCSSETEASGIAIPPLTLETDTSSKSFPIPLPACLLSAHRGALGPSSLPGHPFLFPPFNPLMFGLPSLSSSPPSVPFHVPPLFFPSGSPTNPGVPLSNVPWMNFDPRHGFKGQPSNALAPIIKPSVARPNGSKGGLDAMLRSLSASNLSNLGEITQSDCSAFTKVPRVIRDTTCA